MRSRTALRWSAAAAIAIVLLWLAFRARDARPSVARQTQPEATPVAAPLRPGAAPAPSAAPAAQAAPPAASGSRPLSSIRIAYESEPRDAQAAAAEARIRQIFADESAAEGVLREVHCSASVCKIDARWSKALNRGYNAALLVVIKEFSKQLSFESGGPPEGMIVPMTIYVRRPGHEAAAAPAAPPNPAPTRAR